jgi:hypothetical protein
LRALARWNVPMLPAFFASKIAIGVREELILPILQNKIKSSFPNRKNNLD